MKTIVKLITLILTTVALGLDAQSVADQHVNWPSTSSINVIHQYLGEQLTVDNPQPQGLSATCNCRSEYNGGPTGFMTYQFEYPSTGNSSPPFLSTPISRGKWYYGQFLMLASELSSGSSIHLFFQNQACHSWVQDPCYGYFRAEKVGTTLGFNSMGTTTNDGIQIPVSALSMGLNTFMITGICGSTTCTLRNLEINVVSAYPQEYANLVVTPQCCIARIPPYQLLGTVGFVVTGSTNMQGIKVKIDVPGDANHNPYTTFFPFTHSGNGTSCFSQLGTYHFSLVDAYNHPINPPGWSNFSYNKRRTSCIELSSSYAPNTNENMLAIDLGLIFSPPIIYCNPRNGLQYFRFDCNQSFPNAGFFVKIVGPGSPALPVPWTGNNFVSPALNLTYGAMYSVSIVKGDGSPAFPVGASATFPYTNAAVRAPRCGWQMPQSDIIATWDPKWHSNNKASAPEEDEKVDGSSSLFPNPASTYISLRRSDGDIKIDGLILYDLLGKAYPAKIQESTDNEVKLDISDLPAGNYILQTLLNGTASYKKFQKL